MNYKWRKKKIANDSFVRDDHDETTFLTILHDRETCCFTLRLKKKTVTMLVWK